MVERIGPSYHWLHHPCYVLLPLKKTSPFKSWCSIWARPSFSPTGSSFGAHSKCFITIPINPNTRPSQHQWLFFITSPPTHNLDKTFLPVTTIFIPGAQCTPTITTITHHIHLLPQSNPINICLYRYLDYQKTELEKQVANMSKVGLIQLSHSPFSSHVLLVKKKDDSWHCCVNYLVLNAIIVKDRFLVPTIDELLDELGSASWFSKFNLW